MQSFIGNFKVCVYDRNDNRTLIATKYCDTKDEAIKYFNRCCDLPGVQYYSLELWHDQDLLFSTED